MDIPERKDLLRANLKRADLIEINLEGADLQGANLKLTYFIGANFKESKLEEVKLESADLEGTQHLSFYQLSKVKILNATKLNEELLYTIKKISCSF